MSTAVEAPLAPQTYKILETIREGAQAAKLRRVENLLLHRVEVHKTIDLLGLQDALPYSEPGLLVKLKHPHVVPVFDAHHEAAQGTSQLITFAMPYYPEGSVQHALETGRVFSVGEVIRYGGQILGALSYMHQLGYVDRDVKSANVLLNGSDAMLADVGGAALVEADGRVSGRLGTLMYMAPEYSTGRIGPGADIYAMGCVLREMLGGPFKRSYRPETILARIRRGERGLPARELECPPHAPPPLRRVIDKALRKEPELRWQSAAEFADALMHVRYIDWRTTREGVDGIDQQAREYRVRRYQRTGMTYVSCERRIGAGRWRRIPGLADVPVRSADDYTEFFDAIFAQVVH